jgi:hypothetical protein
MLITAAVSLLPVVGQTPDVGGALLMVMLFAHIPLIAIVGLVVGVGALLGAVAGLTALGWIAGDYRQVQEFVRSSKPHPDARLPYGWIAPLGAIAGALRSDLPRHGDNRWAGDGCSARHQPPYGRPRSGPVNDLASINVDHQW